MVILGIDPGTASLGYSFLECIPKPKILALGLIKTVPASSEARLKMVHLKLTDLIKKWRPDALAVERLFFAKNQKTALAVAEARGVILLTTALAGINVYEYTPLEVKYAVTGNGAADKKQVKKMLELTFQQSFPHTQDDALDALAIAFTCFLKERGPTKKDRRERFELS